MMMSSIFSQDLGYTKGGDLADAKSVNLHLGAWCMYRYIHSHLKSRCAETDSEHLCYIGPLFMESIFGLVKGGGQRSKVERGQRLKGEALQRKHCITAGAASRCPDEGQ